jgi:hypothetical protein
VQSGTFPAHLQVILRRRSPWDAALPLKPPFHARVSEVDRITEHERAASDDAVDVARVARSNGFF